jgi:hypothetical protein
MLLNFKTYLTSEQGIYCLKSEKMTNIDRLKPKIETKKVKMIKNHQKIR